MRIVQVDVQLGVRRAAQRELTPLFHREPGSTWTRCFRVACSQAPGIDWQEADFARCEIDDVPRVKAELTAACTVANDIFVRYLNTLPADKIADIVQLENIAEASVGAQGPYRLPIGFTEHWY